jgi:cation:H+ antiporter
MLVAIASIIGGFVLLTWSADHLVEHSAKLTLQMGVSPFIIGVTVIGFGTSAPELLVSAMASMRGNGSLAVGNAIGSNIANIGLVMGSCGLFVPLVIKAHAIRQEFPLLFLAAIVAILVCLDGSLSRVDGLILVSGLGAFLYWSIKTHSSTVVVDEITDTSEERYLTGILWIIASIILLVIASRFLIVGAVELAKMMGVSELVIGLTVIALGTSLPEFAASVAGARKGMTDMVVGNIIGSNIFNSLGVLGITGLVRATEIDPDALTRDLPIMLCFTLAAWLFGITRSRVSRTEGGLLLAAFLVYMVVLCIQAL